MGYGYEYSIYSSNISLWPSNIGTHSENWELTVKLGACIIVDIINMYKKCSIQWLLVEVLLHQKQQRIFFSWSVKKCGGSHCDAHGVKMLSDSEQLLLLTLLFSMWTWWLPCCWGHQRLQRQRQGGRLPLSCTRSALGHCWWSLWWFHFFNLLPWLAMCPWQPQKLQWGSLYTIHYTGADFTGRLSEFFEW